MDKKSVNESVNVQENAQVVYDVTITGAFMFKDKSVELTEAEANALTIKQCTDHNANIAPENWEKKYNIKLFLDQAVPGHGIDENGVKVRKDVEHICVQPQVLARLLAKADARLAVLIDDETTTVGLLKKIVTDTSVSMGRKLVTDENGGETYQVSFEAITLPKAFDEAITYSFTQKLAKNFNF